METNRLLRIRDVERLTGLSKTTVYRLEAAGNFPNRLKLSARASAWRAGEIQAWLDARPRAASLAASRSDAL